MGLNRFDKFGFWCFCTLMMYGLSKYLAFVNPGESIYLMNDLLFRFLFGAAGVGWIVYPFTLIPWPDGQKKGEKNEDEDK